MQIFIQTFFQMSNNTFSAFLVLDKRREKSGNLYPIKLRVIVNRKSFHIAQNYNVPEKYWNKEKEEISTRWKGVANVTRLNNALLKEKSRVRDKLLELDESVGLETLSIKEIKNRIIGRRDITYLLSFWDVLITEMQIAGQVGNARVYTMVKGSISNFLQHKDIPLRNVTHRWLKQYEVWFLGKGNRINGLCVNLRTLRAVLNKAIKRKLLSADLYPFSTYIIKKEATKKRAIKKEGIDTLIQYEPANEKEEQAKDYFLMSYYLMGASFVDLSFLTMQSIREGRMEYRRKKVGRLYSIKITPPLQKILDKYTEGKVSDDFILDVIQHKVDKNLYNHIRIDGDFIQYEIIGFEVTQNISLTEELKKHLQRYPYGRQRQEFLLQLVMSNETKKQYQQIHNALKYFNKTMKAIGKACGFSTDLTSYVARHSFATIARNKGIPVPVISKALGHSDLKTTEVYLAEIDNEVLDKYHREMLGE